MRNYPTDSPEAAARMVALALMADGSIDRSEILLLERQEILSQLGLNNEQFDSIYYEYCTDMLSSARRHNSGRLELDEGAIKKILGEIRDPELQKKILQIMLDISNADDRLTAGEAALIALSLKHWNIDLCEMTALSMPLSCLPPERRSKPGLAGISPSGGFHHVATG